MVHYHVYKITGYVYLCHSDSVESKSTGEAISNQDTGSVTTYAKMITSSGENVIYNNGTLNIESGTLSSTKGTVLNNHGTATISSDSTKTNITSSSTDYCIDNYGKLTVNSGSISSTGAAAIYNRDGGQVTVNGGTIDSTKDNAIWNRDSKHKTTTDPSVHIAGGLLTTSSSSTVVANWGDGMIYMTGGYVKHLGDPVAFNLSASYSGSLYIFGGTVECKGGRTECYTKGDSCTVWITSGANIIFRD